MLNLNYWCEDEEHKKSLLKKYYDNEMKYQEKIMEQYSTDKLFKRENREVYKVSDVPKTYEEPKWYTGILNFIKRIFNKD